MNFRYFIVMSIMKKFSVFIFMFSLLSTLSICELSGKQIKASVYFSEENIIKMVSEGINAIYDVNYEKYKKEVIYESNRHGYVYERLSGFAGLFLTKLSNLGKEIPLEKRHFFWDYVYIALMEKVMIFVDEANVGRVDLEKYKPRLEQYIENECRINAVFG